MSASLNDKFLLASALAGDEEAFGKIYDKYVEEIFRFVLMRTSNKEEAQDLTSEAFLKTWEYVSSSSKRIDNIRALLYRVSRNLVIDYYRKSGRQVQALDEDQFAKIIDQSVDLEESVAKRDDIKQAFSLLDNLSEEYRELLLMRYTQDLSTSEIAKALGKKEGTVRVGLHRAIKQLKEILKNV